MEEKKVPEEQIMFLHKKLTGNEVFHRLRGQFPDGLGMLEQILAESKSPTDFCHRWDQFCADARVMGNLLACLQRDGWGTASAELSRALQDKTYRLPGETIPLDETEPVTIVVFDFPRTLTLIRWIRCAHWDSLNQHLNELEEAWARRYKDSMSADEIRNRWMSSQNRVLTRELFNAFPNLLQHTRERYSRKDYEGWDLLKAYHEHVLAAFDQEQLRKTGHRLRLAIGTYNEHLEIYDATFGYLVKKDQGEVLALFNREQQKRVATWTVRLPRVNTDNDFNQLFIGFHPEDVHGGWKNESTYSTSIGCSNGYGVVVMAHHYAKPLQDHTCRHHEGVSISHVHLEDLSEKLAFELDVQ